ncbi:MAG: hypothetical protein ACO1NV_00670 [Leptospira bouyouniensis]
MICKLRKVYPIIIFILFSLIDCKQSEKAEEKTIVNDTFYMEVKTGCSDEKPFEEIAEGCIKKKENLFCYQYLESLKKSKLDKIFYGENWESNDIQSFIYNIDRAGNIKVLRGGPDKNKSEFELSGYGKLQRNNNKWHYHQKCENNFCDKFDFDIEYVSCFAGYSENFDAYVLILTIENSDWFDDDKIMRMQHKEISYVKIINQKPQIMNGFTSTKVPPIPSN